MAHKIGKQTIIIDGEVGIRSSAAVGSKKEGEGPLGKDFDIIDDDSRFGEKTWEKAESKMQELACWKALKKAELEMKDVDFIFAGWGRKNVPEINQFMEQHCDFAFYDTQKLYEFLFP